MKRPEMFETMRTQLDRLVAGSATLHQALLAMWDAGREAERIDGLLMEKAQREAKAARRGARKGERR
jgi:hypothetical protein